MNQPLCGVKMDYQERRREPQNLNGPELHRDNRHCLRIISRSGNSLSTIDNLLRKLHETNLGALTRLISPLPPAIQAGVIPTPWRFRLIAKAALTGNPRPGSLPCYSTLGIGHAGWAA